MLATEQIVEIRHGHLFCGLGGGKKGFNKGSARVGKLRARFRCIGGIDNDPASIRDFDNAGPGKGTVLDMFSLEQFRAFHGRDPRPTHGPNAHQNKLAVVDWDNPSKTVTGSDRVGSGALSVADPRPVNDLRNGAHGVRAWDETSGTVAGESLPPNGAFSVADPRPEAFKGGRKHYEGGGHYGVLPWDSPSKTVSASANLDNGYLSVADPREAVEEPLFELPAPTDRLVAVIRALDGTWHRPFTTLELAALQSLVDPEEVGTFALDGQSDSAWRERIGNAVPPEAAAAIAGVMGTTLLLAMTGETFMLSSQPIWVQPVAMALAVDQRGNIPHE